MTWEKYKECLKIALINATLVALSTILTMTPVFYWKGLPIGKEELPTFPQFVALLLIFIALEETAFYYIHRQVLALPKTIILNMFVEYSISNHSIVGYTRCITNGYHPSAYPNITVIRLNTSFSTVSLLQSGRQ